MNNDEELRYRTCFINVGNTEWNWLEANGVQLHCSNTMQTVGYAYLTEEQATMYRLKFIYQLYEV